MLKRRVFMSEIPTQPGDSQEIPPSEAHHLLHVLRLGSGDKIEAIDGSGLGYPGTLETRKKKAFFVRDECAPRNPQPLEVVPISLELAIVKSGAMETAIEKAVELGVSEVFPLMTERGGNSFKSRPESSLVEKWQKSADLCLKQCGRLSRMNIHPISSFNQHFDEGPHRFQNRVWCNERGKHPSLHEFSLQKIEAIRVLVGPEGGWSDQEHALLNELAREKTIPVSLGSNILRADTAAIAACAILANQFHTLRS